MKANESNWTNEDYPPEGCVWRSPGTVFRMGGEKWVSIRLGPCNAEVVPLVGARRVMHVSRTLHHTEVARVMTAEEFQDFQHGRPRSGLEKNKTGEEKNKTENRMNIKRTEAVDFLLALGFAKAAEWPNAKIQDKLVQVPDRVETPPKGFEGVFEALKKADGDVIVEGKEPESSVAKSEKKPSAENKPEKKPSVEKKSAKSEKSEGKPKVKDNKPSAGSLAGVYSERNEFIRKQIRAGKSAKEIEELLASKEGWPSMGEKKFKDFVANFKARLSKESK